MEHIKHFYSVDDILFVFAIDQEKLAQYIVNKYEYKSNDNSLKDGYAYLDKFFENSYSLNYREEVRDFMRKIYQEEGILEELQKLENLPEKINLQEMFYQLVEFYGTFNLRKVGNLVREFSKVFIKAVFSYYIIDNENREFTIEQIFRVLIIKEFYPELFNRKDSRSASFDSSYLKYTSLQGKKQEYHLLEEP